MGIGFKRGGLIAYVNVSVSAQTGGTATGSGKYKKGQLVTVTAAASSGYLFSGWYVGGVLLSSNIKYTFAALENVSLEARFRTPVTGDPGTTQPFSYYSYSNSNIYTVSAVAQAKSVTLTEVYVYIHRYSSDCWWGGAYTITPGSGNINLPFVRSSGGSAGNYNIAYSFDGRTLSLDSRQVDTTYCDRNFAGRFNF